VPTPVPPTTPRDASCADASDALATTRTSGLVSLFPPRDADAAAYRAWVAASPWPEVVFAAAGHR
jgi:hypothetical protein